MGSDTEIHNQTFGRARGAPTGETKGLRTPRGHGPQNSLTRTHRAHRDRSDNHGLDKGLSYVLCIHAVVT